MSWILWKTETYTWTDYRKYLSYIDAPTKTALWNHKEIIVASSVVSAIIALLAYRYLRKPTPQKPLATFATTLNIATLNLEAPAGKVVPPNVNFAFCIDKSSSMEESEREKQVKQGITDLLNDAHGRAQKGAHFDIGLVGFNSQAHVISPPKNIKDIATIKQDLDAYRSEGSTSISAGLTEATQQLEAMAKVNKNGLNVLVLLSDGEENLTSQTVNPIRQRLQAINGRLFAIGIGAGHNKQTLQTIAADHYIDTTDGQTTIVGAISQIYQQVIATYSDLKISTTLPAGTWSLNKATSTGKAGQSECALPPLAEGKKGEYFIKIHGEKLSAPLKLSTVKFGLSYLDPKGIGGNLSFNWCPNTTIDNKLLQRAQNFI